jgi:L,D-transpeptidase catalytic domain
MMRPIALMGAALVAGFLGILGVGPANAGLDIYIDKSSQLMTVAVDGVRRYTWPVSTGAAGYVTPSGTYTPFRMERDHRSEEWDDAPMPHSIFFTYQGHAIHGSFNTRRLGTAASHGCVRLAPRNAATLFNLVTREGLGNTKITVASRGIASASRSNPVTRTSKQAAPTTKFGDWLRKQRR